METLESIKQDWNSLLLIKKENGSRNPIVSEKYPEWRDRRVSEMVKISESVGTRRKRVSCEEELREQVKRLQAELKTKEDLRLTLEHQLAEEKAMRKLAEEERDSVGRDRMKAMNDLESLKVINKEKTLQVEKAQYWEELAVKTQAVSSKRLTDIKELKSQLKDVELELVKTKKIVKATQNLRTELNSVKIEAKALGTKLVKGEAKTEQFLESQKMMENHIQILDTANNSLSRNNLIHIERIGEFQEQIDRAATEAHWLRVEARQVGGDIAKYRRSMNNTDMFLKAIANRGSAFPPVID
jgi:chromosome segregation ATPase